MLYLKVSLRHGRLIKVNLDVSGETPLAVHHLLAVVNVHEHYLDHVRCILSVLPLRRLNLSAPLASYLRLPNVLEASPRYEVNCYVDVYLALWLNRVGVSMLNLICRHLWLDV